MIFDHSGNLVGQHQREHRQILPSPGWVEHDPQEIWERTQEVITQALEDAGISGSDLLAIGITNQRETVVAWDISTGKPLANAIVWQDVRTAGYLSSLSPDSVKIVEDHTGLRVAPYFSASKMNWLIKNSTDVQKAIAAGSARFGTIDSWLLWNLTGKHFTDVSNASRTLLMNLETLEWDEELLTLFEIPRFMLPEIRSSSEVYATTFLHGPFLGAVRVCALLGDQQAAMVGQTCFERGEFKTTYGTGNFALLNTGNDIVRSRTGLLTTVLYKFGDQPVKYALEGSVAVTGSAIQWLRDQLGIISAASEIEALASNVSDTGGVYFVPAFSGLFAPHWRSDARGAIVGLTRATTKAHLARAALEAICYQTKEIIDAMLGESLISPKEMRVDGAITGNELCMQIQSDIMGITITRPHFVETTALGAAYAAGLAVGFWSSTDELRKMWQVSRQWTPATSAQSRELGFSQWRKAVDRTLGWVE